MYLFRDAGKAKKGELRVQLMGSGTILREVIAAAELLEKDFAIRKGLREDGSKLTLKGTVRLLKTSSVPAAVGEDTLRQVMAIVGRTAVAVLAMLPPDPVSPMLRREIASFSRASPLSTAGGPSYRCCSHPDRRICSRLV
jgi:hypothetical protein